ncbi:MAG: hypothetical protein MK137_01410 [Rickettsiales bacterium]|nr:hypothetical protein [Rickettsiales bacterium]
MSYSDGNAIIEYDYNNTITLLNIAPDSLSYDDFTILPIQPIYTDQPSLFITTGIAPEDDFIS